MYAPKYWYKSIKYIVKLVFDVLWKCTKNIDDL